MHPLFQNLNKTTFNITNPQYWTQYLTADVRQTSIAIAVWLIPVLLFAYADYGLFGLGHKFTVLLTLRLIFCAFSLYTIFVLRKVTTPREYDYIFLRWAASVIVLVLFITIVGHHLLPRTA